MKEELDTGFIKTLKALPEIKKLNYKEFQQLCASVDRINKDFPYAASKHFNRVTTILVHYQRVISDTALIRVLQKTQGKCQSLYSKQKKEQKADYYADIDYSYCMCKDDY